MTIPWKRRKREIPSQTTAAQPSSFVEAARREFAGMFGDLARGKRNWQVMAFALAGVLAIVVLAYVRLASSTRLVPYVIEVDRLGQVVGGGAATPLRSPDDRLIASQLAQFIRNLRTVLPLAAASAQADMVRRGYAFVGSEAAGFLNDYFSRPDNDPRVLGARVTRRVEITSVLRMPGAEVWTVRWTEAEAPAGSEAPTRTTAWEAYLATTVVPPSTVDGVQDNPLGLYITSLTWTPIARGETPRGEMP